MAMGHHSVSDYYAILGMAPGATADEIGRTFHRLAKRFHPDNPVTGDRERFDLIVEAHAALKDAVRRSDFESRHHQGSGMESDGMPGADDGWIVGRDVEIQDRLLAIFYAKRRRNIRDPGVPEFDLERTFGCPIEHLEFHLWYLREKRWVERLENGMFGITVAGIDHVNAEHHRKAATRLLMNHAHADEDF